MPYTIQELEDALRKADAAGDTQSAVALVKELDRLSGPEMTAGPANPELMKEGFSSDGPEVAEWLKGAGRGVLAGVGLVGDLENLTPEKIRGPASKWVGENLNYSALERFLRERGLDLRASAPKTKYEEYRNRTSELMGGMALGPAGTLMKRELAAIPAGLVGQFAKDATGQDWTAPLGEILGLAFPGFIAAKTPNVVKATKSAMEQVEKDLPAAETRVNRATNTLGTPGFVTQGLEYPSQLEGLLEGVSGTAHGAKAQEVLKNQLIAAIQKGRSFIDELSSLPANDQKQVGKLAESWAAAVKKPEEWLGGLTKNDFDLAKSQPLTPDLRDVISQAIEAKAGQMQVAPTSRAGKAILGMAKNVDKLENPTVGQAYSLAKEGTTAGYAARQNPNISPKARATAVGEQVAGREATDILENVSPELAAARSKYRSMSRPLDEMKASGMPDVFAGGFEAPSMSTFTEILTSKSPEQIRFMARNLGASDAGKQQFGLIMKQAWSDALSEATASPDLRTAQDATGKFVMKVAGMPGSVQRERALAAIEENAKLRGMDPGTAKVDAEELFNAFAVASRSRGGVGAVDMREAARAAGANPVSATLRVPGWLTGSNQAAMSMERFIAGKTWDKFIEALTDPTKAHQLAEIARYSPAEQRAKTILTGVLGIAGAETPKEQLPQ